MSAGLLIALEGGPGSGTDRVAAELLGWCDAEGVPAEVAGIRDPWLPLGARAPVWPPACRVPAFLYALTEAADIWARSVAPSLAAGCVVICDRYRYTLLAHARARDVDARWSAAVATILPEPGVALYLRSDPARQWERLLSTGSRLDGWEIGSDLACGQDLLGGFRTYQSRVGQQLDGFCARGRLAAVDADADPQALRGELAARVRRALEAGG